MRFKYDIYGSTETGLVRLQNEDHILVGRFVKNIGAIGLSLYSDDDYLRNYGLLLAVSDGIGGEPGGDIASHRVLNCMEQHFYASAKQGNYDQFNEVLVASVDRSNANLIALSEQHSELARMGCTLSGICLTPIGYLVFNAGDSRVYRVRNGTLKRLTQDDTLAQWAVRRGTSTLEEASTSTHQHTLTNYLGYQRYSLNVTGGPALLDGDHLMICSDGLYDYASESSIEEQFTQSGSTVSNVVHSLFHEANLAGGGDNISIIVMRVSAMEGED